jgi:transcriptional regulator with XRE-family HTH domain
MDDILVSWVNDEIAERGWSMRELARRGNISHSSVSLVLSGQRKATHEFCEAIATATGTPVTTVLRMAGLLPRYETRQELVDEILYYFDRMDSGKQRDLIAIAATFAQGQSGSTRPSET